MANNEQNKKSENKKITRPVELQRYLRVTSPSTWIIIFAVLIILVGCIALCSFGTINITKRVAVENINNVNYALIPEENLSSCTKYPNITIDSNIYELTTDILEPKSISDKTSVYVKLAGELEINDIVYPVKIKDYYCQDLNNGQITIDSFSPISLLINN